MRPRARHWILCLFFPNAGSPGGAQRIGKEESIGGGGVRSVRGAAHRIATQRRSLGFDY